MANTNVKKRKKKRKSVKKLKYSNRKLNLVNLVTAAGVILILVVIILAARGCGGNSHRTPEGVVESYIKAAAAGKTKSMADCYGVDSPSGTLQTEIESTVNYFKAHGTKSVNIQGCESVSDSKDYTYIYIRYNLVLSNEQEYPCLSTYLVKAKDKKYYIYQPDEITDEISQKAATDYQKFMITKTYEDFKQEYDVFLKKNPGYEDEIASKLQEGY